MSLDSTRVFKIHGPCPSCHSYLTQCVCRQQGASLLTPPESSEYRWHVWVLCLPHPPPEYCQIWPLSPEGSLRRWWSLHALWTAGSESVLLCPCSKAKTINYGVIRHDRDCDGMKEENSRNCWLSHSQECLIAANSLLVPMPTPPQKK